MNLSNSQRQLGYTEVLFNSKTQRLVAPLAGDNYTDLTLEVNDDGGVDISQFTTADINLDNPTTFSIPDAQGLGTQKDLNEWIVNALDTVYASEAWVLEQGFLTEVPDSPEVNLDGYATEQWVNEQGFLTEVPDSYTKDESNTRHYSKEESDARFVNVNIQNLTHVNDYDDDDDYFALKTAAATNFARVRQ